ncbi:MULTISPECIES: phage integrase SAM-like domain-containing protein, partial [unclassified Desulfovibrio]|uniref:phage integrase SAM-like domain-containing protein n=1 Tax=unclassified Desulfovibrio TaxID=2593640 RepID=UPI001C8A7C98
MSKVFEMYLAEKGRSLSVGTVVEFRLSTRRFMEFAGDLPIRAYNKRQHIIRFKDALLKLPTRLPRRLQQTTLPEILKRLERERGEERQTLTAVTVNSKYLSALHTVFEYAIANGILENNPCSGVKA